MPKKNNITRKILMQETPAPYWVITHLTLSGRLPLLRKAEGQGSVNIYHPDCIDILREYMQKKADVSMVKQSNEDRRAVEPVFNHNDVAQSKESHLERGSGDTDA